MGGRRLSQPVGLRRGFHDCVALAVAAGTVSVSFAASVSSDVAYYHVYRSTTSGFTPGSSNEIGQTTLTSYTDSGNGTSNGLPAGSYYYKAVTQDTSGLGSAATAASPLATVVANTSLPKAQWTAVTPASGSTVATPFTVEASASDPIATQTVSYGFDPAGFRRARTLDGVTTRYLLGGLIETSTSGTISMFGVDGPAGDLARYTTAPSAAVNPTYAYFSGHGDLAVEADQAGSRTGQYRFDAFGGPRANTTIAVSALFEGFTGAWNKKLEPATGLVEMGARPYDSKLGRFLAVDPVDGGALNGYEFALQDPVNRSDLGGMAAVGWGDGGDVLSLDECNMLVVSKPSYCRPPLSPLPPYRPPAYRKPDPNHHTVGPGYPKPPKADRLKDIQTAQNVGRGVTACVVAGNAAYWSLPVFSRYFVPGKVFTYGFTAGACATGFVFGYKDPNP